MNVEELNLESPWQFEHVRVSVFPRPGSHVDPQGLWTAFGGLEVEEVDAKPKLGVTSMLGGFPDGRLLLTVEPTKIDWRLAPPAAPDELSELSQVAAPNLSIHAISGFLTAATDWVLGESSPAVVRAALGVVCLAPVEGEVQAYTLLQAALPSLNLNPAVHSDLIYQVNRREVANSFPGLVINCLSKWTVRKLTFTSVIGDRALAESVAVRRELDINTLPGRREDLPRNKMPVLMKDFVRAAGKMLAEVGQHV